jgi:uncharacterized protein YggU (UPF0235/DUF167 family)
VNAWAVPGLSTETLRLAARALAKEGDANEKAIVRMRKNGGRTRATTYAIEGRESKRIEIRNARAEIVAELERRAGRLLNSTELRA